MKRAVTCIPILGAHADAYWRHRKVCTQNYAKQDQGVARFPPPDHRRIPQVQDLDTVIAPGPARTSWGRLAC